MIIFKDGKPFLAGGSPSRSLTQCMLQNTINILDFGMPIDESVSRPRYGSLVDKRGITIEKNYDELVWKAVEKRGVAFHVVNPWNFDHGAFEGIHVEPGSGMMIACGDPRRHSKAEGV
jgi:gamma-glutamyltranspeptidase/glutathione hydrolase